MKPWHIQTVSQSIEPIPKYLHVHSGRSRPFRSEEVCAPGQAHFFGGDNLLDSVWQPHGLVCWQCQKRFDPWQEIVALVETNFMRSAAYALVGGRELTFTFVLHPNQPFIYSRAELQIPIDSRVVFVSYTPQTKGGLFPAEAHGNEATRRDRSDPTTLFGVRFGLWGDRSQPVEPTEVATMIRYLPPATDVIDRQLQDAAEHFAHAHYDSMVLPAHSGFEIALTRLVQSYFSRFAAKEPMEQFSRMSFGQKLDVLLPMLAGVAKAPALDKRILTQLSALQAARNKIAHQGKTIKPHTAASAAALLTAALFGVSYVRRVQALLTVTPPPVSEDAG